MANWTFQTPYVLEGPSGNHRLFYFAKLRKGITILKSGSTYSQARYLMDEELATYTAVYRGGYKYIVDDTEKAALIAGGVSVTEANFTAV
jgi:hypothetical protein